MAQEWDQNVEVQTVIIAAVLFPVSWFAISWVTNIIIRLFCWLLISCLLSMLLLMPDTAQRIARQVAASCLQRVIDWISSTVHHPITIFHDLILSK
jgi:hypothetical protein